jgi:hypothetical protein
VQYTAYDEIQREDQVMVVDRRPNDPEEMDHMYRVFAAPINVN